MVPKQKIEAEANAEVLGLHDVGRPPPCGASSCGPRVVSALASARLFCYVLTHILFSNVCLSSFPGALFA